jgi:putative PIN family toxin of toxin-antitoxin system
MECMRIFLDANILISGIIFKGKEHELLIKNKNIFFITSEDVLQGTRAVIIEKFPESSELVEIFLSILNPTVIKRKDYASKLNEYSTVRDKNDRHILAAAIIGKVDYIVTGDADLLSLKNYNNISIVQARKIIALQT